MNSELPNHVALILDGNRRWAKQHHLPSIEGHRKGAGTIRKIIRYLAAKGVHTITIWIFSTENWNRDEDQVHGLMKLFEEFAGAYLKDAEEEGMRICHLGRKDRLSESLRNKIAEFEAKTSHFEKNTLNIALDYGGRDELIRAFTKLSESSGSDKSITEKNIDAALDTAGQKYPNPDMIIRTGGEQRISGFMLWQGAYAEYFFTDTLLPDLSENEIENMLSEYAQRQRRYGA